MKNTLSVTRTHDNETLIMDEIQSDRNSSPICSTLDLKIVESYHFWVKGILLFFVAIVGLILNIIAVHILSTRNSMKNTFNSLLISLFCVDSFYLINTCVMCVQTLLHTTGKNDDFITILVPHFLYPMMSITLAGSILMTVGIAHERHLAIKSPIKHRQSMTSSRARRNRLIKYVLIVTLCSFAINATKFLELEIVWSNPSMNKSMNATHMSR
jgi:hypothetical protein